MRSARLTAGVVVLAVACVASTALAHSERHIDSPIRPGPVPDINRINPKRIVVCKPSSRPTQAQLQEIQQRLATATGDALAQAQREKAAWQRNNALFAECCTEHIQIAVDAAADNTDILIMPGIYREEPSRAVPTSHRGDNPNGTYSYEYQQSHPNDANLIGIFGKKNITLEGTGARPEDVVIDAGFVKDVGIRADRSDGFIARNFFEKDANEHGVYTVDSDGYVYDHVIGSFNKEYELFAFACDNGLMVDCEVTGGGDSGFYIGGAPDTHALGRYSQIIRHSKMYHNVLGFSGTQGTSVLITDCDVYDNAIGISFDSENSHPNFPQRFAVLEHNDIHDNNFDIYASTADVPTVGLGYNTLRLPVGTGITFFGATDDIVRNNRIYNNKTFGVLLAGNPLEGPLPAEIHRNQFVNNLMGEAAGNGAGPNGAGFPPGRYRPGGSDFIWDGTGNDNCWGPNGTVKTDPTNLPGPCPAPNSGRSVALADKLALLGSCSWKQVPDTNPPKFVTADQFYPCPFGHTNDAQYESRDQAECGNGAIDPGEDCDPGEDETPANLAGQTCASLGHGGGQIACDDFCQWDFSGCTVTPPAPTPAECVARDVPPPTATPSAPVHVDNGDSCAVVMGGSPQGICFLLSAGVLLWTRRRHGARGRR